MVLGEARTASSCSTAPSGCALFRVCPCCFGTARRSVSTSSAWTPTRHGCRSRRARWCTSSRDTRPGSPSRSPQRPPSRMSCPTRCPTAGRTGSPAHWHACVMPPPTQGVRRFPTAPACWTSWLRTGLTPEDVAGRWRVQPRSTSALLGVAAAGPYTVDLRRDGPHALVGGTTGSGKSELLQTLIASLALGNRPDEMVFVLVDYKGGSAFKDCALLPHTVGMVTDLDGHLTARALASLEAELRRRERLLAARSEPRTSRTTRPAAGAADARLPRLLLVIDEFKALAEELPDFLDGLVRIAARGRSLGIHLVLATQRPGGIVSADIKANVNLRIALRVRDTVDSDGRHRRAGGAGHTGEHPWPGLRPFRRPAPRALPDRPGRRTGPRAGGLRRQRVPLVVGHGRGPTSSPTGPWRRQRPDRPGPRRRGHDPRPHASRASRAPLPRGSRHCRTSWLPTGSWQIRGRCPTPSPTCPASRRSGR